MSSLPVIPFNSPKATLETTGGKGLNLAHLTRAGFPVPPGFLVSTEAYRAFVRANRLQEKIRAALKDLAAEDMQGLERASESIRAAFAAGSLSDELAAPIRAAYGELNNAPVAVRSSATAEDLPDLSFAGQQDTYLNVIGADELLKAVVSCWSSLWTARAIGYRLRNRIGQDEAALAVVVQEMVQSEVSGVLFTANPLTGLRSEAVIDATLGLGEALVSGQVEPDHYVVDTLHNRIVSKALGEKKISTRGKTGGGVETISEEAAGRQALSDAEIVQLAALGQNVQKEYGFPQDIEWAFAGGKLYLLQARAITSLYPVPEESFDPLKIWFSFGAVQGLLSPMTPLGQDAIRTGFAGGATHLFGAKTQYDTVSVLIPAGERLWIRVSDVMRHPIGAKIYPEFLAVIEPSVAAILRPLSTEPGLGTGKGKIKPVTVFRLLRFALPIFGRVLHTLHDPEGARAGFEAYIERQVAEPAPAPSGDVYERLGQRVQYLSERISAAFPAMLPRFIPVVVPSLAALGLLTRLAGQTDAGDHGVAPLVLEVTRGLPNNVTTEMDMALWETARAIQKDTAALAHMQASSPAQLTGEYLQRRLPPAAQQVIETFMARYGMRGVGEIDMGEARWRERPEPIMQTIQSYLQITDGALAPDVLFARGAQAAEEAIEKLAAAAGRQPGGWLKEKLVRFAARRIRVLMGMREAPKFFIVRIFGKVRNEILASGKEFSEQGLIEKPDDLLFLHIRELEALARREQRDWKGLIAARRAVHEREARRRQVPRVLVSDGRAFYEGLNVGADTNESVISGSPVSPGVVEGVVHVVFNPNETQLVPGEILVCPGTDPAWTPLFMAAGGLVTEVGGMMTHGSVVAREYGIPAVVGVHQATQRLKNGQKIRLDGTAGKIIVIG
jgi:pyruvate,water dikinase